MSTPAPTTVTTTSGPVRGLAEGGLTVFRGVPFAAPPVGGLRFAAPRPPAPWEVLDATSFGPVPPQSPHDEPPGTDPDDPRGWLTANVWTPDVRGARPVMVWIHGGAYRRGSSADPSHDGAGLATEGDLVVVTANHRVGVEGFGLIEGAPANRGLLDQVAVLRWVRDNAAAFGGDPDRVTVFGESAGAGAVAALLAMPSAAGLFARAIAQSVPGTFLSPELAADVIATIAARLGRTATVDDLRDVAPDDLVAAGDAVVMGEHRDRWGALALTRTPYSPVVDGDVLPSTPWHALRAGASWDVDLIVGHTRDEYRLMLAEEGRLGAVTPETAAETLAAFAPDAEAYRVAHPGASPERLVELVLSDWLFRMPSLHLARDHRGRSFLYELTVEAPGQDGILGACHALDVPLVFGDRTGPFAITVLGADPPAEVLAVGAAMRAAWTAFAYGDGPGWGAYNDAGTTRTFGDEPDVAPYPEATSAALWADHDFAALPLQE